MKKKRAAEVLIESLKSEKVDIMFGYPGGVLLPIYDVLYDSKIKHILPGHEQGGAHMADGYARASGKAGVVMATSGPGATNLITGIATAYMDSVPLVALTGQVPTSLIGGDAFQEADVTGITRPIVKHNYLIKDSNEMGRITKEAFYLARTGRPGPVVVDIPKDVAVGICNKPTPKEVKIRGYNPNYTGHSGQIKKAAKLINSAEKPVFYVGGGVIISDASAELKKFAEKAKIPVTTTMMGLGAFPETNPLALEMLGMHGTVYANYAMTEADLIIAVGARFDDRVTGKIDEFAPNAKIIHIDIDPAAISKNIVVDIPIVGDVKSVLKDLLPRVNKASRSAWNKQVQQWKKDYPLSYSKKGGLKPQQIIEEVYNLTKGNAIIVTEVGQHQMWAAQFYKYTKPRHWISSGGLGTMGFGLPASIGAKFARPDKTVIDIAGDGSLLMNIQELATAVKHKLPIKIVLLNNQYLGMVRQWQQLFFDRRYSATDLCLGPDFVKVASAFGAKAARVTKEKDIKPALKDMFKYNDGPAIVDFTIAREENVFPMVPAGAAINNMLKGE